MTKHIDLGTSAEWGRKPVQMDVERLLTTRLLVQANSGGGKSYALRRLLEQLFGLVPLVVIDLDGEFFTLREKFPFVLASAGAGGDCKVDVRSAPLLARRILEHGFSVIIDLSEMKKHDRAKFVRSFLEALMEAPRSLWRPLFVCIDEAHQFCPEKDQAESAAAVIDLMTRGRKRGFCGALATQRISKLSKDAAAECNNKLIGRSALDVDMKRAADELGFNTREQQHSLRSLDEGGFYAFGPAISKQVTLIKMGAVQTTHLEPGHGGKVSQSPPPAKLKAILDKLSDLPAQAEAEEGELARLRRENADLRRTNADLGAKHPDGGHSEAVLDQERRVGYREGYQACSDAVKPHLDRLLAGIDTAIETAVAGPVAAFRSSWLNAVKPGTVSVPVRFLRTRTDSGGPAAPRPPAPRVAARPASGDPRVSGSMQRILDALAWLATIRPTDPADKTQVALLADQSPSSSGYQNNLGALRSLSLIDYPRPGMVHLTEAGHAAAQAPERPPSTEDLHRALETKLPRPLWLILRALIQIYPDSISKEDLADAGDVSPTSSGYQNNLGRLRSLGFIDYPKPGHVIARPELFLEKTQ